MNQPDTWFVIGDGLASNQQADHAHFKRKVTRLKNTALTLELFLTDAVNRLFLGAKALYKFGAGCE